MGKKQEGEGTKFKFKFKFKLKAIIIIILHCKILFYTELFITLLMGCAKHTMYDYFVVIHCTNWTGHEFETTVTAPHTYIASRHTHTHTHTH